MSMTLQLQQAIKLLQLSRQECVDFIENEMLENPFLEEGAGTEEYVAGTDDAGGDSDDYGDDSYDGSYDAITSAADDALSIQNGTIVDSGIDRSIDPGADSSADREFSSPNDATFDWNDYFSNQNEWSQFEKVKKSTSYDLQEFNHVDNLCANSDSLENHLFLQLDTSAWSRQEITIAREIIGNLDENGYLVCDVEELAEHAGACRDARSCVSTRDHDITPALVESVLKTIQKLDPPGIAARNLQECLEIQLRLKGLEDSLAYRIVGKHLQKLGLKKYEAIAKEEGCPLQSVFDATKLIMSLNPKPGDEFNATTVDYIIPDVYVHKFGDEYVVSLNDQGIPKLHVSTYYQDILRQTKGKKSTTPVEEKEYIKEKYRSANWLIKSIEQRQATILRVTKSIMKFQRRFLDDGVCALKPLVLKDVAQDVNLHESTISRVTTNKYVHTPQGIFELKFFFSSALKSGLVGEISSEVVKEKIKTLVSDENPLKPLSDQMLVSILKRDGIDVARRTVAKYREMQNILASSQRKRVF